VSGYASIRREVLAPQGRAVRVVLWSFGTGEEVFSSPAVANGVVYNGSDDGHLYAFHLPCGLATPTRSSPAELHPNHRLRITN
jgi:hypothetical protein